MARTHDQGHRLDDADHAALAQQADPLRVRPGPLARMLVHAGLSGNGPAVGSENARTALDRLVRRSQQRASAYAVGLGRSPHRAGTTPVSVVVDACVISTPIGAALTRAVTGGGSCTRAAHPSGGKPGKPPTLPNRDGAHDREGRDPVTDLHLGPTRFCRAAQDLLAIYGDCPILVRPDEPAELLRPPLTEPHGSCSADPDDCPAEHQHRPDRTGYRRAG